MKFARIAQPAEQRFCKSTVGGSKPSSGTTFENDFEEWFAAYMAAPQPKPDVVEAAFNHWRP